MTNQPFHFSIYDQNPKGIKMKFNASTFNDALNRFDTDVNAKEVTMNIGNWYLTAPAQLQPRYNPNTVKRHSSIIHCCNPHSAARPTMAFPVDYLDHTRFNHTKPSWRCASCYKKPPKDILTVFILENWDWASEEAQRGFWE